MREWASRADCASSWSSTHSLTPSLPHKDHTDHAWPQPEKRFLVHPSKLRAYGLRLRRGRDDERAVTILGWRRPESHLRQPAQVPRQRPVFLADHADRLVGRLFE